MYISKNINILIKYISQNVIRKNLQQDTPLIIFVDATRYAQQIMINNKYSIRDNIIICNYSILLLK